MYPDKSLKVAYGQFTSAGQKAENEDCIGIRIPSGEALQTKGVSLVIADGVSSAEGAKQASEICVQNFLTDYYSTPDTWRVRTSVHRVLSSLNRWLYSSGQEFLDERKGFICALGVMVLKGDTAHIFHVGDTRIHLLRGNDLQQLTKDHAVWGSKSHSYLSRAMGLDVDLDIDYWHGTIAENDLFILTTDGIHDHVSNSLLRELVQSHSHDLDVAAEKIANMALSHGSADNLSAQIIRVQELGIPTKREFCESLSQRPFPPDLSPGQRIDGYEVLKVMNSNPRSQLYHVRDLENGREFAMKTPSHNFVDNPAYIERFLTEEWIGRRVDNDHLVKVVATHKNQKFLFYLMEKIDGISLSEWITQNPTPEPKVVIGIVDQIIQGLRAMHRRETLHQDLKPDNIMIEANGNVKIIDLGSAFIAGVHESRNDLQEADALATRRYSAPEYRLGKRPTEKSDQFSLGLVAYELFTGGHHPFGEAYERAEKPTDFAQLKRRTASEFNDAVPTWIDYALGKALTLAPENRYPSLSEFLHELSQLRSADFQLKSPPLIERDPVLFWKILSAILFVLLIIALAID